MSVVSNFELSDRGTCQKLLFASSLLNVVAQTTELGYHQSLAKDGVHANATIQWLKIYAETYSSIFLLYHHHPGTPWGGLLDLRNDSLSFHFS